MKRLSITVVITVLALFGAATPAAAHNVLVESAPEDGTSLESSPDVIELTFDQAVQEGDVNQIAVTGPHGNQWVDDPVAIEQNVARTTLGELGQAGEYTIGYRIISADGHPVGDEIAFTLTSDEGGTPADDEPAEDAGEAAGDDGADGGAGVPIWAWLAGAGALLAAGIVLALRLGKAAS